MEEEGWVPGFVREWLEGLGYALPLAPMEGHIAQWWRWMRSLGDFYDYRDVDGVGRLYEVHRRSLHPAMRVCREWGSLLLNDKTVVSCDERACTEWLRAWAARTGSRCWRAASWPAWAGRRSCSLPAPWTGYSACRSDG